MKWWPERSLPLASLGMHHYAAPSRGRADCLLGKISLMSLVLRMAMHYSLNSLFSLIRRLFGCLKHAAYAD